MISCHAIRVCAIIINDDVLDNESFEGFQQGYVCLNLAPGDKVSMEQIVPIEASSYSDKYHRGVMS